MKIPKNTSVIYGYAWKRFTCQIQLHLETDVDIGTIDRRRPPESETTIRNLIQAGTLCISQFLKLHGLFEARRTLPEQPFPKFCD